MQTLTIDSHVAGRWTGGDGGTELASAVTGETVARTGAPPDIAAMVDHARSVGGPALRALTFHDRARILKALAAYLVEHKEALYALSTHTGATRADSWIDIEGGTGTLGVYAAKGRREMPDAHLHVDGPVEALSRKGSFVGQHVCVPLQGVAVQINAFNFPVWGMLEKLAPALLAGMPVIVKPATQTAWLTHACVRLMLDSGVLPAGALQLLVGPVGDLLDRLGPQDVVGFTGSAATGARLRAHPALLAGPVRFTAEQDSLNAAILGPDAGPDSPEFELFVKEAAREITTKAGQKCTAMRRLIVPAAHVDAVAEALTARLSQTRIGDPALETTRMGALVSLAQRADVRARIAELAAEAEIIHGDPTSVEVDGADPERGAFMGPVLLRCADPDAARAIHEVEAFGPVATLMPCRDMAHAAALANRGGGSLVASLFSHDPAVAARLVTESAACHGRIYVNDRDAGGEATGHGSPMPHMTHGGPGRAGGGEELGGIRAVLHHMQRTAVQGSPAMIRAVTGVHVPGAPEPAAVPHPFRQPFGALVVGETLETAAREVTLDDIEHFARFTGDTFYAHMDEEAARANPFFPGRVAHGYLLLSFAAGLFVDPAPGPVLANTGLTGLSFLKPVVAGDRIRVRLTVKEKRPRNPQYGEVRWRVVILNQDDDTVAEYDLHTMNATA